MEKTEASNVVRQCADLRERAASEPMTIATAIERAQSWRKCPELVVDTFTAKIVADTLLSAIEHSRCYYNAMMRGQETFVLAQQDRAAPSAIAMWATLAAQRGCSDEKVSQAFALAKRWNLQPLTATKWPD